MEKMDCLTFAVQFSERLFFFEMISVFSSKESIQSNKKLGFLFEEIFIFV